MLDHLVEAPKQVAKKQASNPLKELVEDFERELGRMLSPFELEDLQKTIREDKTEPDLVRAACAKLFSTEKQTGITSMPFCAIGVVKV